MYFQTLLKSKYKFFLLLTFLIFNWPFNRALCAEKQLLSEKTLRDDLAYYERISGQKKLNANDRYYILLKIYNKYKDTSVDISPVVKEIKKVKSDFSHRTSKKVNTQQDVAQKETKKQEGYKIEQGDILSIKVYPAEEFSRETVVLQDGTIDFPLVGNIKAKGLTPSQLSKFIEDALSLYVRNPSVSVSIKYFSRRQVFVMGEVVKPGSYEYRDKYRLFDLITTAGGFTQFAGTKNIKVHRGQPQDRKTITVNLDEILRTGDFSKDFILDPGDIVEVPRQPKKVSVIGEVRTPGNYDWKEDMFVLDAVSISGGPTDLAKLSSVKIFRSDGNLRK